MNITWRKAITAAMRLHGETWDDVVAEAPPVSGWDRVFYNGYGGIEGEPFTLWTHNRVYFPVCYDGAEWADSVPSNPCAERVAHVGG
jgi:hypothetical protein